VRVKEGVEGPKTKGLLKGLKLSLKLSQGLLFQHSDNEEEIAGKEPERVPVEPETPDVAVPAKQSHDTTIPVDSNVALRKLAVAVPVRASRMRRRTVRPDVGSTYPPSRCWNSGVRASGLIQGKSGRRLGRMPR